MQTEQGNPTAFTVFFEMPFDLGLDLIHTWTYESGAPWPGWDLDSMGAFIGVPGPLEEGTRPQYRLVFRRTRVRVSGTSAAAEGAFFRWIYPARGIVKVARNRLKLGILGRGPIGRGEYRTVVGVTRYSFSSFDDDRSNGYEDAVHEQLTALNDFLTAYGLMSHDPLVGALSLSDLPGVAPLLGSTVSAEGPVGLYTLVSVHPWQGTLLRIPRTSEDIARAATLFDAKHRTGEPTFEILALLHTAKRDMIAGRHTAAAIGSGTAIELLVASTLLRGWRPAGLDPARLHGVLQTGFKNQLTAHLPRVLDEPIVLSDATTAPGRWWHVGYALRNEVVHGAHRPAVAEVHDAIASAYEFVAFVGRALDRRPEMRAAMGLLPTQHVPPRRYAGIFSGGRLGRRPEW